MLCGLSDNGEAECWGDSGTARGLPDPPPGPFTQISAGNIHACALRANGSVECWGSDVFQEGLLDTPTERLVTVSAGYNHSCGLQADGSAVCWGHNTRRPVDTANGPVLADRCGK